MAQAPSQNLILIKDAINFVGPYLEVSWIGSLTPKEIQTLKMIGPWLPSKASKLKRAMRRDAKMNKQRNRVVDWIFAQRVLISALDCDLDAIKKSLAAERAKVKPTKVDGTEETRGRKRQLRERIAFEMLTDIDRGKVDPSKKPKGDFLAKRYGAAPGTCKEAWKIALIDYSARKI
jgi:hypothetical protein